MIFLPWIWRPATFRRWQIMGSGYCPAIRPLKLYLQIKSGWWSFLFSSPFQLYHILQTSVLNQVPQWSAPVRATSWCIKATYWSIWDNCYHIKFNLQLGSNRFLKVSLKLKTLVSLRFKMSHLKKWIIEMGNFKMRCLIVQDNIVLFLYLFLSKKISEARPAPGETGFC